MLALPHMTLLRIAEAQATPVLAAGRGSVFVAVTVEIGMATRASDIGVSAEHRVVSNEIPNPFSIWIVDNGILILMAQGLVEL